MPKLENWSVVAGTPTSAYQAPETIPTLLFGNVYDHPRFENGTQITTSLLLSISFKNSAATTLNTQYELGKPSQHFLRVLHENGKNIEDYEMDSTFQ